MFRFAHPGYLFLLLIIPVLIGIFVYSTVLKRRKLKSFGNPDLMSELMPNVSLFRPQLKFYIQLFAILMVIIVLAQPQFGTKLQKVKRKGIEVMIALDVSNSMLAQDVQPDRLDNAKQVLSKLVGNMTNDKVGLVVFAGDAYVQLPITADYVSAKMYLSSINTKMVPIQGTAIGTAIDKCIKSFGEKTGASRVIVLITDGENHEDDAVAAAKLAKENGIRVDVVGMGKQDGAPIPIPGTMSFFKDKQGNVVVSKMNEKMCREIAMAGGGVFVRGDNTNAAYQVISNDLSKLKKSEINSKVFSDFDEQYQSFALIGLLILIIDTFVFDRKNKRLSKLRIFDLKDKIGKKS